MEEVKTPKQMAEEYCHKVPISGFDRLFVSLEEIRIGAFKSGYQAAQEQICNATKQLAQYQKRAENALDKIKNANGWITTEELEASGLPLPAPPKEEK